MSLNQAKKVIIITEKIILKPICEIIEKEGATGYTIVPAGGKGSRGKRSNPNGRASVIEDFVNVKIEVIVNTRELAEKIIDKVADKYFQNYSGITYLENIEILRPFKFDSSSE